MFVMISQHHYILYVKPLLTDQGNTDFFCYRFLVDVIKTVTPHTYTSGNADCFIFICDHTCFVFLYKVVLFVSSVPFPSFLY